MTFESYKKYLFMGTIVIVVLVLLGFGGKLVWHEITKERPQFNSGLVVNKDFNPAHYDDYPTQQYVGESCSGSGNNRTCTSLYITVWHHDYVPDRWSVQIKNCSVNHKDGTQWVNKDGSAKCFKKWVGVDVNTYDQYHEGDEFSA